MRATSIGELTERLEALADSDTWTWPEDARELIFQGLGSPDPEACALAISISRHEMDDEVADQLLELADASPKALLRAAALVALGLALGDVRRCGDEGTEPPLSRPCVERVERRLRSLYHDASAPKEVRRRALEAAVRSPQSWQTGAVRSAFASGDPEWQASAIFSMGYLSGFEEELRQAMVSDSPPLVWEAVRSAGRAGLRELGYEIYDRAVDRGAPHRVRLAAVEALPYVRPPGTRELLEQLSDFDDEEVSARAAKALGELTLLEIDERVARGADPEEY